MRTTCANELKILESELPAEVVTEIQKLVTANTAPTSTK
jgi:hypothetical protein